MVSKLLLMPCASRVNVKKIESILRMQENIVLKTVFMCKSNVFANVNVLVCASGSNDLELN